MLLFGLTPSFGRGFFCINCWLAEAYAGRGFYYKDMHPVKLIIFKRKPLKNNNLQMPGILKQISISVNGIF